MGLVPERNLPLYDFKQDTTLIYHSGGNKVGSTMRHLLFFTLPCATIPAGAARITYTDHPILSAYDGSMR